ncbi:MAG: transposase [Halobacteriaceae archaeon]
MRRRGWHRIGSRPTVEIAPSTDRVTVLGAVTHDGRSFYCWTEENLTAEHGIRFLEALEAEFGEKLIVLIDRAGYFYARDLWEFVSGERETECIEETSVERVRNETLQAWYFPPRLPELNPVEQCWNQLEQWFNYLLIEDLTHLQVELRKALKEIDEPNLFNYLLPAEVESDLKTN